MANRCIGDLTAPYCDQFSLSPRTFVNGLLNTIISLRALLLVVTLLIVCSETVIHHFTGLCGTGVTRRGCEGGPGLLFLF